MNKKLLVLALAANCAISQCTDNQKPAVTEEEIALAQLDAAKKALENIDNCHTRAEMGAGIVALGVVTSLANRYLGGNSETPQNCVFLISGIAIAGGLLVAWTGDHQRGNPHERAQLISIIENPRKTTR